MPAALQLLEVGYPVRAILRRDDHRAVRLRKAGAEIVVGNLHDLRDLRRALKDVQRAYHCQPFAPNLLHGSMLFAIAAEEAKLEVVAHLGAWNPHPEHVAVHQREQWAAGSILPWMPSVDVIHLNPGLFAFTYFLSLPLVAQFGLLSLPHGDGLNAPPSNEDIASVAVHALIQPEEHIGKHYRPTGPKLISGYDAAEAMASALGRRVKYQPSSDKLFTKAAIAMGFSRFEVSQVRYYMKEVRNGVYAEGGPTDHVLEVTGRNPEDFLTIAQRYTRVPEARRSFANQFRAANLLIKTMATRVPDLTAWLDSVRQPTVSNGKLAHEIPDWVERASQQRPSLLQTQSLAKS